MYIESDERYTPLSVLDPLTFIFGELWDPCPRDHTLDGLSIEWESKNFVNPPYSNIRAWVHKSIEESKKGRLVVFLIPNDATTEAYKILKQYSWCRLEIPFRVKFETPEGKTVDVARSHCVFLLGGLWDPWK